MSTLDNIQAELNKFSNTKIYSYNDSKLTAVNNGYSNKNIVNNTPSKVLYEYDFSGNFVKEYPSINDFIRENKIKIKLSSYHIKNRKIIGGKIVKFEKYDKLPNHILDECITIKVYNPQINKIQEVKRK